MVIGKLVLEETGQTREAPKDRYVQLDFFKTVTFADHFFEDLGILGVEAIERLRTRAFDFQRQHWRLGSGHEQSTYASVTYDMESKERTTSRRARVSKEVKADRGR